MRNHNFKGNNNDGWMGVFFAIVFNNDTSLHCDLSNIGMIKDSAVDIRKHCNLKDMDQTYFKC